jgi:pimeloyl-ACP methyl ester carboxylesterase
MPRHFDTRLVPMRDGRYLCAVECGDPSGRPAFYFHGGPGSRIGGLLFDDAAKAASVRLIIPDRPGMGFSEPRPGRRVIDWSQDVEDLAEGYALDRFGVFGASGGGPYALATARGLPDRLTSAVVASGIGPLADEPDLVKTFGRASRRFISLAMKRKSVLRVAVKLMTKDSKEDGKNKFTEKVVDDLPDPDAAVIAWINANPDVQSESTEVRRQGLKHAAADLACVLSPWGFDLREIGTHVSFWHGADDPVIPPSVAQRCAELLKDSEQHIVPGGHQMPITYRSEIFAQL